MKKAVVKRNPLISRVKYQVKVTENGKTVDSTFLTKKAKVVLLVSTKKIKKGQQIDITVTYKPGVNNSGSFTVKETIYQFLNDCTDKMQLDFVYSGKW